ncbi:N-acetylmuramoyl-L-alanine amidase [Mycobacterium uberis]|uniref:N-acetylmuramoyl-L-alanine amidase n=1 Tax=Mycobacterium uberis TaxID=2162698 RepID=A0A3E1HK24_9MYCO|nr:N-acetylmuramoyl-L-alanine amidase [Mycobacterium uberis]
MSLFVAASTAIIPTAAAYPYNPANPPTITGMAVFIDPGHNGSNDASISRQVPTGRGGTKDCQTSGTSTNTGYQEHTFTWDTALLVRAALNALGVQTTLSRDNDTALGPCVDARANMANAFHPNAIVSLHGDGGPASGRGFHINYSAPPLNPMQAGPSVKFARIMRDQLQASGIPPANYIGQSGLYGRSDLAGLNLSQYPSILIELGNMKNPADSTLMKSPEGRQKYAGAVVRGVTSFLATQDQAR